MDYSEWVAKSWARLSDFHFQRAGHNFSKAMTLESGCDG